MAINHQDIPNIVYKRRIPTASNRRLWVQGPQLNDDPPPPAPSFENEQPPQQEPFYERIEQQHQNNRGDEEDDEDDSILISPLLPEFRKHVAANIWDGIERLVLKFHNHIGKLLEWDFEEIPQNQMFRSHFAHTGLLGIKNVSYTHLNKKLIAAFVKRWHPETNFFHLLFGEMTITLDDVHCLTGLSITGRPIISNHTVRRRGGEDLQRLLGMTTDEVAKATRGEKGSSIKVEWLKTRYQQYVQSQNVNEVLCAARAYILYVFSCALFADKTGTQVSTEWLEYLEDMSQVHHYAWGAATLAHLYRQLGDASNGDVRQISSYLTLLEAWIYERFPNLIRPQSNPNFTEDDPLAMKWSTSVVKPSQDRVTLLMERLDQILASEVNWAPYSNMRERFQLQLVTLYDGYISANDVIKPYMQDRVLRQYGYIQKIPVMSVVHRLRCKCLSTRKMKQALIARAKHFNRLRDHVLTEERLGEHAFPPWQCSEDYMEWYRTNSHVRVQNPEHRQMQNHPVRVNIHPQDRIAQACALLDPLLQRWRAGERITTEEVMPMVDEARTALQAVDVVVPVPPNRGGHRRQRDKGRR